VSCSPATFARDTAILTRAGYQLKEVTAVDQFRYAAHVEIVARLER
jgi:23S rRNA (uracil1939-C5)-methyltransferase